MSNISQTNRCILFETINPNKIDLVTILSEVDDVESLSDEIIEKINSNLLVKDFDDFLKKFEPVIYSYYDVEKQDMVYTLEKNNNIPNNMVQEIKINKDNDFFRMLVTLIDSHNNNKLQNVKFNYEDILESLNPKKMVTKIKQTRKEISYIFDKYNQLEDDNPEKLELADRLNIKFEQASQSYNNVLSMLPLAIEDISVRLNLNSKNVSQNRIDNIKTGLLTMASNGNLEVIESQSSTNLIQIDTNQENSTQLAEYFRNDYYESTNTPNEYIATLVARSFAPLNEQIVKIDVENEITNYNSYMNLFKKSQENFIKIAKELVSKILGVKMFFSQYDIKNDYMKPSLLITNFNPNLLEDEQYKNKIEAYFNTVNNKNDFTNTIWFGILPDVNFEIKEKESIKRRFAGTNISDLKDKNKLSTLLNVGKIAEKYKIQIFFNFSANEYTDFKSFSINGVDEYIQKTKDIEKNSYAEYLIPVMPNFTVIPKNRSRVFLGNKMSVNEDKYISGEDIYYYINGIYIDASYIACGLVASYQCPYYLKQRFNNININNPGVRINIEAKENNYKLKTNLPREISGYTKNIKDRINELNYGFIFCSENAIFEGKPIDNIFVYKARSLNKKDDNSYEPLYKILTMTYIERILRYETSDFKEDRLEHFFSNSPNSVKTKWQKEQEYENAILKKEDDMNHIIDTQNNICNLEFSFHGDVKNLNLQINRKE